jgi:hypothetical protein
MLQTALTTVRRQLGEACSIVQSTEDAHLRAVLECVSTLFPAQLKEAADNLPVKIPAAVVKSAADNTVPAAKAPTAAAAKPAAASKAPTKVAARKAAVPSQKKAKSDSDSDSSANSSPKNVPSAVKTASKPPKTPRGAAAAKANASFAKKPKVDSESDFEQ